MNLASYCVHLQACCSSGIRSQSRIRITSMVHKLKTGVFGSLDLSDIGIIILGAIYAGVLVILIVSRFYCKGVRYTSPPAAWVEVVDLFSGPAMIQFAMRPRYGTKSTLYKRRWVFIAGMR